MIIFSAYNTPSVEAEYFEESMTQQEFKDECDINKIMSKYVQTGTVKQRTDMARFGDFYEAADYHEAQNIVLKSKEQFSALPSDVRERFKNDPIKFLSWIHSKEVDMDEAHKLGLLSEEGIKRHEERKRARVKVEVPDKKASEAS